MLRLIVSALVRVVCTVVNSRVVLSVALVTSGAVVKPLSVRALLGFDSVIAPRINTKAQKQSDFYLLFKSKACHSKMNFLKKGMYRTDIYILPQLFFSGKSTS